MSVFRKPHRSMQSVTQGPLANGEGWYDTIDGCDCAETMILVFANKLEIWAKYALS